MNTERGLQKLGREVAAELDAAPLDPAIAEARRRLLEGDPATAPPPWAPGRWAAFAGLSLAGAAAVAALLLVRRPSPMGFEIGDPPVAGSVGEWVTAAGAAPVTIRFEDGARFEVGAAARARVASAAADSARLELERGAVHGDLSAAGDGAFTVAAGPFDVAARRARFDVAWDVERELFTARSFAGTLVVNGPHNIEGLAVAQGSLLRVSLRDGTVELGADASPQEAPR